MNQLVKTARGFGIGDPVPVLDLDLSGGLARESSQGDKEYGDRVMDAPELMLHCPWHDQLQPVGMCRSCPYLRGVGNVTKGGGNSAGSARVVCGWPKPRPMRPVSKPVNSAYAEKLKNAAPKERAGDSPEGQMERVVFLREAHVVNCPINRYTTGEWATMAPPCLACKHYRGLKMSGQAILCLCGHPRTIQVEAITQGESLLDRV